MTVPQSESYLVNGVAVHPGSETSWDEHRQTTYLRCNYCTTLYPGRRALMLRPNETNAWFFCSWACLTLFAVRRQLNDKDAP